VPANSIQIYVHKYESNKCSLNTNISKSFSNIPLEQPPNPQATVYEGFVFIWGERGWGIALGVGPGSLRNMS